MKGDLTMKQYLANSIMNIALLGHANSGKSTVAEALIHTAGASERMGQAGEKNLIMNFDAEERRRGVSVSTAVFPVEWQGKKLNLLDAPGLVDFAAGVREALNAAETALLVLSGKSGLTVGAEQCLELARENGRSIALFISKLDSVHAQFYGIMSTLAGKYGAAICPVFVPICDSEHRVTGFADLVQNQFYSYQNGALQPIDAVQDDNVELMRTMLLEAVAAVDEALMEKYFSGEAFTVDEILTGLKKGMLSGEIWPVFSGIGQQEVGILPLLEVLTQIAPTAAEKPVQCLKGGQPIQLPMKGDGPAAALVFKTVADPFVGKLSYLKVVSGTIGADSRLQNSRTGQAEKLTKLTFMKAGTPEETAQLTAGDIGCAVKLGDVLTGDTLSAPEFGAVISSIPFPNPTHRMAVYPRKKGEEEKIAVGLARLMEEDPTLHFAVDPETKESVLSGLGEQHLDVTISRLKTKFGVEVELREPKVAYRETIRGTVKVQGRHKKQSGGHGQFGDVWIEFMPCDSEDLVFEENIFGGSVPKSYFPAVEKGLQESMKKGVLAGFPMVGVKAVLYDGSYHPVDSSEMAFKTAAALAFRAGIPQASPVILEPIGSLTVTAPDDNLGDVIGDINKRRGRVIGMTPLSGHRQEILAEVPMAQMGGFSTAMRSLTQGRAAFALTFARYEDAPPAVAAQIAQEHKAE